MSSVHTATPDPGAADVATTHGNSARVTSDDRDERRGRDLKRIFVNVARIALPVAVVLLWEFASGDPEEGALIDDFYVSTPTDIWAVLKGWAEEGILAEAIWSTLQAMMIGFAVGAVLGIVVGIILGSSPVLSDIFRPFLVSLNAIPRLALVPLFILWFGFGLQMKVALVALIVFFLVFYATYEGVRDVEERLLDVLKVMDASKLTLQLKVRIPSAMAWIIQGLQVSIPYALVAAVTAEIIGSNTGVGFLIQRSAGTFNTAGVFAGIVVLVLMSVVINALVTLLERRLLRWKPRNLRSAR
jgi:NitT/TauT family transport system permease protein